jgi:hypothetical protein
MTHSLQHAGSKLALKKQLIPAIREADLIFGCLYPNGPTFDGVRREALKSIGTWMNEEDINFMIFKIFTEYPSQKISVLDDNPVKFSEVFDSAEIEAFADHLVEAFATVPRQYEIYFPLKNVKALESCKLTEHIEICQFKKSENPVGDYDGISLKIHAIGYVSNQRRQSAMRNAESMVKLTCKVGTLYGLFIKSPNFGLPSVANNFFNERSQPIFSVKAFETENPAKSSTIQLGTAASKYLGQLTIPFDFPHQEEEMERCISRTSKILDALLNPISEENVISIRRALQWSYDANIDEDETTSFIKTCIGLEALLAEQNEKVGITEQLADRCAFVLYKTAVQREETRILVRNIYQLRSKIVHGNVSGLSNQSLKLAQSAEKILDALLIEEINAVIDVRKHPKRTFN